MIQWIKNRFRPSAFKREIGAGLLSGGVVEFVRELRKDVREDIARRCEEAKRREPIMAEFRARYPEDRYPGFNRLWERLQGEGIGEIGEEVVEGTPREKWTATVKGWERRYGGGGDPSDEDFDGWLLALCGRSRNPKADRRLRRIHFWNKFWRNETFAAGRLKTGGIARDVIHKVTADGITKLMHDNVRRFEAEERNETILGRWFGNGGLR